MNCCHHCLECPHDKMCINNVPIFRNLSESDKRKIVEKAIHRTYAKGEIIFSPDDIISNLFVVNQGRIKITKISTDGREQVMRILTVGDFFGELSLFSEEQVNSTAIAMENSEICIIRGQDIKNTIISNPEIAIKFLEAFAERMQETEEMVEKMGIYDIEQRIVKTLLYDVPSKNNEIHLPFSKADFASIIGTTRETLSRKLTKFQKNGWIKLKGQRHITILNYDALEDILYK